MAPGAVLKVDAQINVGLAGFVEAAEANGWELVPRSRPLPAHRRMSPGCLQTRREEMVDGIAAAGPIDAVYLDLHGAMVT
jgi:microcystin degradation protein MlrC